VPQAEVVSSDRRPFYESYWFWGGLAAAAAAGGAFYLTRDTGPTTVHLQMNIPH
jgi:hypothetical protein